jgi:hypothetical protein
VYAAVLGAVAAHVSTTARRPPLLVSGVAAVLLSRSPLAIVCALASVVLTALSTRHLRRRAVFARGAAGGLAVVSLLETSMQVTARLTGVGVVLVVVPILVSGLRWGGSTQRRRAVLVLAAAGAFAALASAAALATVMRDSDLVDLGTRELELGLSAARAGDADTAAEHFERAGTALAGARDGLNRWGLPARAVPIVGQHVESTTTVLDDVVDVLGQAGRTAGLAGQDRLAVRGGKVPTSEIAALENPFRRLARLLGTVRADVADRLDDPLIEPLSRRLRRLGELAGRAEREAALTADAAAFVPRAFGGIGPRRYLVLFTSPAEARGRFGFPGSFAEVLFEDGQYRLGEHGTSSSTFGPGSIQAASFDLADERVEPYLRYGVTGLFTAVTVAPDFETVAHLAAEEWEESGRPPVDGVLRFDPASLAALLQHTGPVQVPSVPVPLTSENLEQFLLVDQYLQFPSNQAPRRELLDTVAEVTFGRLETADLPPPQDLVDLFAPLVRRGHLNIVAFDRDAAPLFDRSALSGAFDPPASDSLVVTSVNSVGNKIDTFLSKSVTYEANVDEGHLAGVVRVELTNAAPPTGLPFYVIGSAKVPPPPRGTNLVSLLVYTSVEVDGATLGGAPVPVRTTATAGRWLTQLLVELPPGGSATVELRLDGPLPDGPYRLALGPGGGVTADTYQVRVSGARDTVLTYGGRVTQQVDLR